jgi:hypothetical protein
MAAEARVAGFPTAHERSARASGLSANSSAISAIFRSALTRKTLDQATVA